MFQGKPLSPETQIFIGDLSLSVVESDLFTLASRYGEVVYIRILRDYHTKQSMGFAFVAFSKAEQAINARNSLNGTIFKETHIRVARFHKDRVPEANLYVSELPESATVKELEESLLKFGPIISSKISYDKSLKSNKYGYVQFEKKEHAAQAIGANVEVLGSKIQVAKFLPPDQRISPYPKSNLYVRGFDSSLSAEELLGLSLIKAKLSC